MNTLPWLGTSKWSSSWTMTNSPNSLGRSSKSVLSVMRPFVEGELKVYKFPKAVTSTPELINVAEFFFGGITYNGWMTESLVISEKGPFDNADVIVIVTVTLALLTTSEVFNTRR